MVKSLVYTVEGILTVEYEYNYLGDRITKTVDGDRTTYTLEYSSGLSQIIEETTNSKTVFYVRGLDLISREELGKTYFYVLDGGNTVRDLVDEDGNVTDKYIFDSFGNEISHEGDSKNSYGFQGEQLDEETGLYYLRARYMNSSTGTFTSMDTYGGSLSDPTSLHKYLFANSNPVKYCDPTGHSITLIQAVVTCAIIGALSGVFLYATGGLGNDTEYNSIGGYLICAIIGAAIGTAVYMIIYIAVLLIINAWRLLISLAPCAPEVEEETERVALGIREYLDDFARDFNALTWKDLAPDGLGWKDKILQALQDPNVRIYFNLDGLESVWSSIQRVASGYGGATEWELYQIYSNPDIWDTILWFREGMQVPNPFS